MSLVGDRFELIGAAVGPDQAENFDCPVYENIEELLETGPAIVAIANENDRRLAPTLAAFDAGCDVIVDKPLGIRDDEQDAIEAKLKTTGRRLLMLLTLRGEPSYVALRDAVQSGRIGEPVFTHVRMAVRLKKEQRPPWFLDSDRSGGLFLDLLIHGLDYLEWLTGRRVVSVSAVTGNLGNSDDPAIRDHAAVFCRMNDGGSAIVEGQRMLPDTKGSDYRVHVVGTRGYADMDLVAKGVTVTDADGADATVDVPDDRASVVLDWLDGGDLVPQAASLRANRLALAATRSAGDHGTVPTEC